MMEMKAFGMVLRGLAASPATYRPTISVSFPTPASHRKILAYHGDVFRPGNDESCSNDTSKEALEPSSSTSTNVFSH